MLHTLILQFNQHVCYNVDNNFFEDKKIWLDNLEKYVVFCIAREKMSVMRIS